MNTVEATVFRRPTVDGGTGNAAIGISQEANVGLNNPLQGQAGTCILNPSGTSARYRGVGTGEVIDNGVCASNNDNAANCKVTGTYPTAQDGIAYTFFSYGNISKEANQDEYGYLTLDGIDPIFSSYGNQVKTGAPVDPGQPADGAVGGPGVLPGAANLPAGSCESGAAAFPCSEDLIWAPNPTAQTTNPPTGLSFPNLRNGTYPAWGILRVFSDSGTGGQYAALSTLIASSNKTAVGFVPDYVPLASVASFCSPSVKFLLAWRRTTRFRRIRACRFCARTMRRKTELASRSAARPRLTPGPRSAAAIWVAESSRARQRLRRSSLRTSRARMVSKFVPKRT